jgi:hypothetical protein
MKTATDPRRAGGYYYCGYWKQGYRVVWINPDREMKVRWDDGTTSIHRTMWNPRFDRIIRE